MPNQGPAIWVDGERIFKGCLESLTFETGSEIRIIAVVPEFVEDPPQLEALAQGHPVDVCVLREASLPPGGFLNPVYAIRSGRVSVHRDSQRKTYRFVATMQPGVVGFPGMPRPSWWRRMLRYLGSWRSS